MDYDRDGIVYYPEYLRMLKERDPNLTNQQCKEAWEQVLNEADMNGDGSLSLDEFILNVIRNGALMPIDPNLFI